MKSIVLKNFYQLVKGIKAYFKIGIKKIYIFKKNG